MHGISRALARERASRVHDLRYTIHFDIPREREEPIRGRAVLSFELTGTDAPLLLDFAPVAVGDSGPVRSALVNSRAPLLTCTCNEHEVGPELIDGHIVLPPAVLERRSVVHLEFVAGDGPLNRREDYLYTIFVPARAHEAFPCFDQPDLKAHFTLSLTIPADWAAVSNTAEERPDDDGPLDRRAVRFAETQPISPYLFAFAAGAFDVEATSGPAGIRVFYRSDDRERIARNVGSIADTHEQALSWLTEYTAIPYPFGKLDVVLLPAFQFGGMEHPGAIFYNAGILLPDPSVTGAQLLARAHVIAHETAHMWFGNLVTMTWFDDVWMKEVFANLMAAKIVNPRFAAVDHDLQFFHAHYAAAYDVDRTAGTNPIRQPLDNLLDAGSLYGPIVYLKSAIVMRQLELALGETTFRGVLREYLRRFRFGNAAWPDLLDLIVGRADFDVRAWSAAWIDEAGRPTIRAECDRTSVTVTQRDPRPGRNSVWPQRLDVALGFDEDISHVPATIAAPATLVERTRAGAVPRFVLPGASGRGYGCFELDDESRDWLLAHLPALKDPLTRAVAWLTLWDGLLEGHVTAASVIDLAVRAITTESNELNLQRVLTCSERLFWIFVDPGERPEHARRLEEALRNALDATPQATVRSALFASLRHVAVTERTVAWLRAIWANDFSLPGVQLSDDDRIALAMELAVRGDRSIVRQQTARTSSAERLARLTFIAPAVSPDADERALLLTSLHDERNRRREPWVIEALSWLHHPLRALSVIPLIAPALDLLPEIKRTGDIFLPRRWTDAMLRGHRTSEAADVVRGFLETLPATYPAALRRVVLVAADPLFRVVNNVVKP